MTPNGDQTDPPKTRAWLGRVLWTLFLLVLIALAVTWKKLPL